MSSLLSPTDLARLERALRVALDPLGPASPAAWGAELSAATVAAVGDGMLGSVVAHDASGTRVAAVLHTDVPPSTVQAYMGEHAAHDPVSMRVVRGRLAVAHDFDVCPPEEFYRTTYYGDYLRPHRLHGNFTAQAYGRDGNAYRLVATTLDHPSPAVLAHGRAVLALLQPAFAAGIAALERATAAPGALGRVLDQLAEPTLVCDRRGRTVHQNPALDAVLAEVRTHSGAAAEDVLRRELGALTSGLGALLGRNGGLRDGAPPPAAVREVQVGAHRLRARACFTGEDTLAREALVWVTIERVGRSDRAGAPVPARPDHGGDAVEHDAALRVRHSLTAQELAVARLMAERRTDAEIGRALGISPNTARTHAERVRRKLGVARRTEVAAALGHG